MLYVGPARITPAVGVALIFAPTAEATERPMNPIELSVVAPVYNEADGIERVVRHWAEVLARSGVRAEIVLANDGSTDATGAILDGLGAEIPALRVVSSSPNHGYGFALQQAIRASRGEVVVTIDSDGQFDLADFAPLLALYRERSLDFVTGYRDRKRDGAVRVAADRVLNLLVRALFATRLRDTNCAMKLIRGDLARSLHIESRGYPTPTEITLKLVALGAKTAEAPVTHAERLAGRSKLLVLPTSVAMLRFLIYLRGKIRLHRAGILQTL